MIKVMADEPTTWWKAPAVVAAVITGMFTVWVAFIKDGNGGSDSKLHVADVQLSSTVGEFYVRCPTTIRFEGKISVDRGNGAVSYRFRYSDGFNNPEQTGPIQQVQFDGPRTADVTFDWTPSIPSGRVSRTVTLEVLDPASLRSNSLTVNGTCDARLPQGPDQPPPRVPGPPGP